MPETAMNFPVPVVHTKPVTFQGLVTFCDAQQTPTSTMVHQHVVPTSQVGTTVTETREIWRVQGATGRLKKFGANCKVSCIGAATITVDLKVNGASVLASVITLNSGSVAGTPTFATISTPALAVGDIVEQVTTATAGGGTVGTNFGSRLTLDEDAVP